MSRIAAEQLERLQRHPLVHDATVIAYTFGIDPAVVIRERDPLVRLVRLAATNLVQSEHKKAAKKSGA